MCRKRRETVRLAGPYDVPCRTARRYVAQARGASVGLYYWGVRGGGDLPIYSATSLIAGIY